MIKKSFILIVMCVWGINSFAQSGKLKKADELYSHLAYAEAIKIYKDLIGTEHENYKLYSKLADCYYQLGLTELAEYYYFILIHTPDVTAYDVYNYAQALKENGNYNESAQWMQRFAQINKEDSRGIEFLNNQNYLDDIKSLASSFEVQRVDSLNTSLSDFGGYYFDSKLYIISNRKGRSAIQNYHDLNNEHFLDIYELSIRNDYNSGKVKRISKEVNSSYHEGPLCFSEDDQQVYFTRNNIEKGDNGRGKDGIKNLKIYVADIIDGKWLNQRELRINSPDYSVGHPTLSSDGKTLYFVSDMPGGYGGADLYKVAVNKGEVIGEPENLGASINTEGQEVFPWMASNGILYYASDGHLGLGGLDIFAVVPKDGKEENVNLGEPINSSNDDFAFIMHESNLFGHVSSNRKNGNGGDDIYAFRLNSAVLPLCLNLSGLVLDEVTGEILPNATVQLFGKDDRIVAETTADEKGNYSFSVLKGEEYLLKVNKESYPGGEFILNTNYVDDQEQEIKRDLPLRHSPINTEEALSLIVLVVDEETKEVLRNSQLELFDASGFKVGEALTDDKGYFEFDIDKPGDYSVKGEKDSYYSKVARFGVDGRNTEVELGLSPMRFPTDDVIALNGVVIDKETGKVLPNAVIDMVWDSISFQLITDEQGNYHCVVPKEGDLYIETSHQGYHAELDTVDLKQLPSLLNEQGYYQIDLISDPNAFAFIFVVENGFTHEPLSEVEVVIENKLGEDFALSTDENGEIRVNLMGLVVDSNLNLVLHLKKEGYLPKDLTIEASGIGGEDVHGNTLIDEPIEVYNDLAGETIVLDKIYFDLNKSTIRPDAALELDSIVRLMNKFPEMEIYFTSHTDCRASKAYNLKLSQRRAMSSKAYIQARITNPERINGEGKGEEMLVNDCGCEGSQTSDCTEEQHAENRRTEFEIIKME
ncbi:carboxypeptidase regulatory-like domain-containing protein [Lishizhenia sp.]|uniref:carboxypeptidase regulatory-like domain-containing protein n=1 Tax=Lishizhenia sp. TaxID=2497594 RepID=UPI00299E67FB|nr:carboxypeptidase regulatory-like domain-containing protein [Lishizhenia sp.]MDX1446879.1 carboxypeptidase regulatory-like domain-containing protein [Lishizhenia sp.]